MMSSPCTRLLALTKVATFALLLTSCRTEPGSIEYQTSDFTNPNPFKVESLAGPDPFVAGERRLSFGVFYEGDASEFYTVDDATVFYYIYQLEATGEATYGQAFDTDRIEGEQSVRWTHRGLGWWGGGIHFAAARNLSGYKALNVSFKSSGAGFALVDIGMESEAGNATLNLSDYGYTNDGEWYTVSIPLLDFEDAGVDLTAVTIPFMFGGGNAEAGESIRMDNLYFD